MSAAASMYAKAFDAIADAAQRWSNASGGSGCPVRLFGNGGACLTTARRQDAALVGVALQVHPAPVQHVPPAVTDVARRCAYVYFRERPARGKLSLTGPNPVGGVHCHQCPRIHVSLEAVGASIADHLHAANLSCAGVNSLPDASGGADAVLRGLAAGAMRGNLGQGQGRPTFHWLKFEPDVGAEHANALQMMLAATSPLLISERGSLWPDGIGIARRASGLRTIMLHTTKAGGPIGHEDVSTCPGELIRGSCLLQGEKPYPGRGGCCEDCSRGHDLR